MLLGTLANFFGLFLPLLLGAFSVPLMIERLGVERFGTLTLIWAVVGYFSLFDFGIGRAITKRIAETEGRAEVVGRILRPGLILMCGIGGATGTLLLVGYHLAIHFGITASDPEVNHSIWIIAASLPLVLFSLGQRAILEARQEFAVANLGRVVIGLATFGDPLVILDATPALEPLVLALVAGRLVVLVLQGWACRRDLLLAHRSPFDYQELIALLHFGGWMTISNLISPILTFADRFAIGLGQHSTSLAYYTTPFEVVTRLLIVPGAVTTTLFPSLARWGRENPALAVDGMLRGMALNMVIMAPMVLVLEAASSPFLEFWLGGEFAKNAATPMRLLAWGVLFNSYAQFPLAFLQGIGRPKWIAILHLVELPIFLLLLFPVMERWGIEAVAILWSARAAFDAIILGALAAIFSSPEQRVTMLTLMVIAVLTGGLGLLLEYRDIFHLVYFFIFVTIVAGYGWTVGRREFK